VREEYLPWRMVSCPILEGSVGLFVTKISCSSMNLPGVDFSWEKTDDVLRAGLQVERLEDTKGRVHIQVVCIDARRIS